MSANPGGGDWQPPDTSPPIVPEPADPDLENFDSRSYDDNDIKGRLERLEREMARLTKTLGGVRSWIDEAPEHVAGLDLLRQIIAGDGR